MMSVICLIPKEITDGLLVELFVRRPSLMANTEPEPELVDITIDSLGIRAESERQVESLFQVQ